MTRQSLDRWCRESLAQLRRFLLSTTIGVRRVVAGGTLAVIMLGLLVSSCSRRSSEASRMNDLALRLDDLATRVAEAEHALRLKPSEKQVHNLHLRLTEVERFVGEERVAISNIDSLRRDAVALKSQVGDLQRDVRAAQSPPRRPADPTPHTARRPIVEIPEIKFEPKIEVQRPSPGPPKKSVDVIVKSVRVASRKSGGQDWDGVGDGSPDLTVQISVRGFGGDSGTTRTAKNTYEATFNEKILRVSEGDTIRIRVFDDDALDDDLIGSYDKELTADTFQERTVRWSFDQVEALVLEFQP